MIRSFSRSVKFIAVFSLVLGMTLPVSAQVPDVGPSSAVIQVTNVQISPSAPPVGTYYTVTATIFNRSPQAVVVQGHAEVPPGDRVTSTFFQTTNIGSGNYGWLSWRCYCGVDGGTVRVWADAIR